MPYLKITSPNLEPTRYQVISQRLTEAINDLFYTPSARLTREQLRERTTVHFVPHADHELYIGGQTPAARGLADVTVELSDWSMSVRQQRKIARTLTPVLAELFNIPAKDIDHVNIRFYSYSPADFAVGGKLLSDLIPLVGRWAKRLLG